MPVWLERSQVEEILAKAKPGLPKTLLATAYDLALRQAEVPLLNRDWFYVKDKSMKVKRLKRRGSAPSESMLPVSDYVVDLLQEWLSSRQDGSEALFVVRGGQYGGNWRRIASRTVNYIYREAAKRAKVNPDKYGFHSFSRHSRGTHLAIEMIQSQGQVDLTRLAKFMGHVSTSSTLLYVHLATIYLAGRQ
jgi:integrase